MKKILGLDLGVGSIGWALVNEAENNNETSSIIKLGVRVNPITVDEQKDFEKGSSITTNAKRTQQRGMRRNLQRYKLRRDNLIKYLKEHNLITDNAILCENGNRSTFETYRLRAKAASEMISLNEFARVLLMINKKRGYKSNRKAKSQKDGTAINSIDIAKELYDKEITPGQYVYSRLQMNQKYIPEFYRSDLQAEFDKIYYTQRRYYPHILTEELYSSIQKKSSKATYAIIKERCNIVSAENKGADKKLQAYRWRNNAINCQLEIEQVVYILCELNGIINNSSNLLGEIGDRSKELYFKQMTIGQMLMKRLDENPNASLSNIVYYRQDYLDEFETIWETQSKYHKELTAEHKKVIRDIIIFYQRNLKSQKGLISLCEFEQQEIEIEVDGVKKKKTIGRRVCPKSSPLFQEFKIWQILNNLVVSNILTGDVRHLEIEEKERLFKELNVKDKLKKSDVLKILFRNHKELDLNYKEIDGNRTSAAFIKACQQIITASGHEEYDFSKLNANEIYDIIGRIFSALGFSTDFLYFNSNAHCLEKEPMFRLWHLLYSYVGDSSKTGDESLIKKIQELCNIDTEYARIIANISLQDDYGSLSSKAISRILPHMKEGHEYSVAYTYAGYNHSKHSLTSDELSTKTYKDTLELLPKNSMRNPVVEKILNQMINVVNAINAKYGKPDEIRIELARELKSSSKEREKMTIAINEANRKHEAIKKLLREEFNIANPSRNDVIRYKLYEELKNNGYKTLYSNTYIPREELFSNKFDIEHIIPQARLFDDSFSNKTLEARDINIEKGKSTAYDYVANKYGAEKLQEYKTRIDKLCKADSISKTKRDKLLMQSKDIPEGFIERDLRNTQYIAKKAREILEELVAQVVPTTGKITDRLREEWGLINIMQELNWEKYRRQGLTHTIVNREGKEIHRIDDWSKRNDHRHHAMDALTVAFTKRGIIQYLNTLNAKSESTETANDVEFTKSRHNKRQFKLPFQDFRNEAKNHLEDILVSIKSKTKVVTRNTNKTKCKYGKYKTKIQLTPRDQLHKETIFGSIKRYITYSEKVGSSFTAEHIAMVANKKQREALLARLNMFNGDARKAFTGKNSLEKNPIYLNEEQTLTVPLQVKLVDTEEVYTIRKNIDKELSIEKVVDTKIKNILKKRLEAYGNDATKAFSNLEENPIWLNKEKGIKIKRVTIQEKFTNAIPIHEKHDHFGNIITGRNMEKQPCDYVNPKNNHHAAIYKDADGNYIDCVVTFYEATARAMQGLPIIDKEYNACEGWEFQFSMKQNEYFVFPNEETGFMPEEIDLTNPKNNKQISANLYRVQKLSKKDYCFRHHLETSVDDNKALKDITWKRITALSNLKGIVKVRINHIGEIIAVGEY